MLDHRCGSFCLWIECSFLPLMSNSSCLLYPGTCSLSSTSAVCLMIAGVQKSVPSWPVVPPLESWFLQHPRLVAQPPHQCSQNQTQRHLAPLSHHHKISDKGSSNNNSYRVPLSSTNSLSSSRSLSTSSKAISARAASILVENRKIRPTSTSCVVIPIACRASSWAPGHKKFYRLLVHNSQSLEQLIEETIA